MNCFLCGENSHFLQMKTTYAVLTVRWCSPHTEPQDGKPRLLWAAYIPWPWPFPEPYDRVVPCTRYENKGCGYAVYAACDGNTKPPRMHSPEAKARRRLANLQKRIQKKAPLFIDQFMAREIAKNPDYFDPEAISRQPTTADIIAEIERERDAEMTKDFISPKKEKPSRKRQPRSKEGIK